MKQPGLSATVVLLQSETRLICFRQIHLDRRSLPDETHFSSCQFRLETRAFVADRRSSAEWGAVGSMKFACSARDLSMRVTSWTAE